MKDGCVAGGAGRRRAGPRRARPDGRPSCSRPWHSSIRRQPRREMRPPAPSASRRRVPPGRSRAHLLGLLERAPRWMTVAESGAAEPPAGVAAPATYPSDRSRSATSADGRSRRSGAAAESRMADRRADRPRTSVRVRRPRRAARRDRFSGRTTSCPTTAAASSGLRRGRKPGYAGRAWIERLAVHVGPAILAHGGQNPRSTCRQARSGQAIAVPSAQPPRGSLHRPGRDARFRARRQRAARAALRRKAACRASSRRARREPRRGRRPRQPACLRPGRAGRAPPFRGRVALRRTRLRPRTPGRAPCPGMRAAARRARADRRGAPTGRTAASQRQRPGEAHAASQPRGRQPRPRGAPRRGAPPRRGPAGFGRRRESNPSLRPKRRSRT